MIPASTEIILIAYIFTRNHKVPSLLIPCIRTMTLNIFKDSVMLIRTADGGMTEIYRLKGYKAAGIRMNIRDVRPYGDAHSKQ